MTSVICQSLALGYDPTDGFYQRYFSFIILGLVMTLGYVFHRISQARKAKAEKEWGGLETELQRAEADARARAKERGPGAGVLGFTPAEELARQRIAELAGIESEPEVPNHNDDGRMPGVDESDGKAGRQS